MATERIPHLLLWTSLIFALVAVAISGRARSTICPALVADPHSDVTPSALPVVAVPGTPHEHPEWRSGREFDRDLGEFRLECRTWSSGHYWDYDHCLLEVPACASEPLSFDHYAMFTNDLVLHRAAGGMYVLSDSREASYLSFRSEPTGHRAGVAPVVVSILALWSSIVALLTMRRARKQGARLSAWRDGVVDENDIVIPADGGARARLATPGFAMGTPVIFAPPRETADYRSADARVEARKGSRAEVTRSVAAMQRRALLLGVGSMAASVAIVAAALARA